MDTITLAFLDHEKNPDYQAKKLFMLAAGIPAELVKSMLFTSFIAGYGAGIETAVKLAETTGVF